MYLRPRGNAYVTFDTRRNRFWRLFQKSSSIIGLPLSRNCLYRSRPALRSASLCSGASASTLQQGISLRSACVTLYSLRRGISLSCPNRFIPNTFKFHNIYRGGMTSSRVVSDPCLDIHAAMLTLLRPCISLSSVGRVLDLRSSSLSSHVHSPFGSRTVRRGISLQTQHERGLMVCHTVTQDGTNYLSLP